MYILLVFVLILVICIAVSWITLLNDKRKIDVPGPFSLPFVGGSYICLTDTSNFLRTIGELVHKYGEAVLIHLLSDRYLILSSPKFIEPVISSSEHITKGDNYTYLHPWLGLGLLTSSGKRWLSHRKLLTPAFHFNILQSFLPIFLRNQKIFNKRLMDLADGQSFDLFPVVAPAALDNITESAMGVCIGAQGDSESEYVKAIGVISEITMMRMFNPIYTVDAIFRFLPQKAQMDKALAILHGHTKKVIIDRHKLLQESNMTLASYDSELGIKKRSSFLDIMLLSNIDGKGLDMESIREEVDTFMFEGHDTTTSAVSFTLYCISNNKGIDEKILEEQRSILGDDMERDPTFSELAQMKYLELVIKEALRLYPSVPLIARQLTKDTDIAGIRAPKGTTITLNIFHMQRKPEYFDNPLEFRPERFETVNANERNVYSWIPFSAGPRNCIGQKFAMLELKVVISSIVKNFNILSSGKEVILSSDLILRSKNGICVKLTPRSMT